MPIGAPDAIGLAGAALVLAAYYLNQSGRLRSDDWRFPALNLAGSAGILLSLRYAFNLPSLVIELAWGAVSIYGIWRARRGGL